MALPKKNPSEISNTTEEELPSLEGFDPHAEAVYSASEAAKVAQRSYNAVGAAKDKLAEAGAKLEGKPSTWEIPHSALVKIGWLNEDGGVIAPRRGRPAADGSAPKTAKPRKSSTNVTTVGGLSLDELQENERRAIAHADDLSEQARIARQEAKAATRALQDYLSNAQAYAAEMQAKAEQAAADAQRALELIGKN